MADAPGGTDPARTPDSRPAAAIGSTVSFRTRLTIALLASALLPLGVFGALVAVIAIGVDPELDPNLGRVLLFGAVVVAVFAILFSYFLAADLARPLRAIAAAVDRVTAGDLSTPIAAPGDDELARLAESHNRLAADLARRNQELGRILAAIAAMSPRDGVDRLAEQAAIDARRAFGMIDAAVLLTSPTTVPVEEVVPGETRPLRAVLRAGGDDLGLLIGRVPATRPWARADQDLLELFASEVAVAIRNAQLFATVEAQNAQLIELDAAKDDFLRGVSHNLQTPLTSIRAYAEQLGEVRPDRRLGIIAEQADRLSRMVRQLLTVSRLESGALRPRSEVVALGTRTRRAWEALGAAGVAFSLEDGAPGWLAIADTDQLDQVLWALLDNAVKHGAGSPVRASITADETASRLRMTISDDGPGVTEADRARLFSRFERGSGSRPDDGTGLGLYVSRELCRAMGGDLILEETAGVGRGATFTILIPGEVASEG